MKYRYLGHSCVQLTLDNTIILIDPFIQDNELASDIDISTLKPDFILLTHGHFDHISDTEEIAKNSGATIVSNYEIANYFSRKGLRTIAMNYGGTIYKNDFNAKYVNAIHSSSFPEGSYGGNPGGFVIYDDEICVYHAGDTALTYDMKLISQQFDIDMAFLPVGGQVTMDLSDAITASQFIGCKHIIGIHFVVFGTLRINPEEAVEQFKENGFLLELMDIGEEQTL